MMSGDLFQKTPSVKIWHHIYHLKPLRKKFRSYYVTRHAKEHDMLVEGIPSSCGDWRRKWFYLDVASCGPRLKTHYRITWGFYPAWTVWKLIYFVARWMIFDLPRRHRSKQFPLSKEEIEEVEVVYHFDRRLEKIRDRRIVREGMKFKKHDPQLEAIAAARKTKSPPPRNTLIDAERCPDHWRCHTLQAHTATNPLSFRQPW